jgi:hypothetical protein
VSQLSNHHIESLDNFQLQGGFCPGDDRLPAPEPAGFGGLSYWVEYFSADRRSGRFLAGPFQDRRRAVRRAAEMLAEQTDGRRVESVTIRAYRA